jgi:NADPH:quinone reductase-like Zn-dependent oxidoreductase
MKCYTTNGSGIGNLCLTNCPEPVDPAPSEVQVEVHAVSLNYRDLLVATGQYGKKDTIIVGSDMAGVVSQVGKDVTELKPGDRVLNAPFRNWPAGPLRTEWVKTFVGGNGLDGVLAEQITYPAASLVTIPSHLNFLQGCTLTVAGLTAWSAVVTHGQVKAGDWVLLHGTGGVSIFALQIAKLHGARIILSTSSEEKAKYIREHFGVSEIINYQDDDWPDQVRDITAGNGADIIVEVAGGTSLAKSIQAAAFSGRIALIGSLQGLESTINIRFMLARQVTVRGIYMESALELRRLIRACDAAQMQPQIDRVFPFEQTQQAYEYFQSQKHIGKVVIELKS